VRGVLYMSHYRQQTPGVTIMQQVQDLNSRSDKYVTHLAAE